MSDKPDEPVDKEYHLNYEAANELEDQLERARSILGRLAAGVAGSEGGRPAHEQGLVERKHVLEAAQLVFGPVAAGTAVDVLRQRGHGKCVFISYATKDEDLAHELAKLLKKARVTFFVARKSIPDAAEWAVAIWQAITNCRVFAALVSAAFCRSIWCAYETGAALSQNKLVIPVLLHTKLPEALKHLEAARFRTESDKRGLVKRLKELCSS
jgi:hypothetical protein